MEPRLKLLDSGGLVGVIRKDLNSPLAVPENRCGRRCSLALFDRCASRPIPREGTRRAAVGACTPRCIRPRRRSGRPPGTLLVPRVQIIVFTETMPPEWVAWFLAGAEGLEQALLRCPKSPARAKPACAFRPLRRTPFASSAPSGAQGVRPALSECLGFAFVDNRKNAARMGGILSGRGRRT